MAAVDTTLASACAVNDTSVVVASATSIVANYIMRIDGETMVVDRTYVSGVTIPVRRGQDGGYNQAHASGAKVHTAAASDTAWGAITPQSDVQFPLSVPTVRASYTASGAIALPNPGQNLAVELNGTSALAMTLAVPGTLLDECILWISSNGAAAHTVTVTGGLSGVGTADDVITINATGPVTLGPFKAINGLWQSAVVVPMAGTVTNVTATVA